MRIRAILGLLLLFIVLPLAASAAEELFLAENGDDRGLGTSDAPIRSLEEAMDRLTQRADRAPTTVWMGEGTYRVANGMYIGDHLLDNVTFQAMPGETPVITGSVPIAGWTESTMLGRLLWTAPFQAKSFRSLYGEDGARQAARWPKEGDLAAKGPLVTGANKFDQQQAFYVNPEDLPASLSGARLRLLHWWKDELSDVMWYDSSTGMVALNRYMSMAVEKGDRYWFENVLGVSMEPGEWAYDAVNGMLYYAPREGEVLGQVLLYAGVTERLITLNEASNVAFEGITFARTGWKIPQYDAYSDFPQAAYDADAAIAIANAQGIRFTGCTFRDIGSGCIRLDVNVKASEVNDCLFENIGAQAVYVHGENIPENPNATKDLTFINNHIDGYGKNFYNAAAILVIHAATITIANNEIHDGTYTAISVGWVWGDDYNATMDVKIRDNWIYDIGQGVLSDMGGIYLLGNQPNTVVSGNIIHDINANSYGGWGIYLDEGSSNISVYNNLVYRCSAQGFHQHNGVMNQVTNNIFAFNLEGQVGDSGQGTFYLDRNILAGGSYLVTIDGGSVQEGANIKQPDDALFANAFGGNYTLVDESDAAAIGFVPWVFSAGRFLSF